MPNIWWLHSVEDELSNYKKIGDGKHKAKHLLSALIFKEGIKGIAVKIVSIHSEPVVTLELRVDDKEIKKVEFRPTEPNEYVFETKEVVYPTKKIEILLEVTNGSIELATSTIGNGMSFIMIDNNFTPTTHLSFGLVIP